MERNDERIRKALINYWSHLGKDAWINEKGDNLSFTLATKESWKDKNGDWQSRTDWHFCKLFSKNDSLLERLKSGKRVLITGKQRNNFNQSEEGEIQNFTYVAINKIQILDKAEKNNTTFTADEIPF